MDKRSLTVLGMTCGHCKASVEGAVGALAGVEEVAVDLEAKRVEVRFDAQQIDLLRIQEVVEAQGFDVEGVGGS